MHHLVLAAAATAASIPFLVIGGLAGSTARAEVKEVRLARQLGLGYLQFYVAQDQKLVEKHGAALGLTASYRPLATPTALTDALLSDSVDIVGIGLTPFLTMWDRTQGNLKVRGIVALNRQPAYLLTRKPGLSSLKEYTASDRIALPAPKVSVQAIRLQMIAEKQLGRHDALDHLTVGMSHPDGTTVMLGGRSEITSHFTSAPFQ
jgi:NitT/TauT family transport system substrate-binding protein